MGSCGLFVNLTAGLSMFFWGIRIQLLDYVSYLTMAIFSSIALCIPIIQWAVAALLRSKRMLIASQYRYRIRAIARFRRLLRIERAKRLLYFLVEHETFASADRSRIIEILDREPFFYTTEKGQHKETILKLTYSELFNLSMSEDADSQYDRRYSIDEAADLLRNLLDRRYDNDTIVPRSAICCFLACETQSECFLDLVNSMPNKTPDEVSGI